MYFVYILYLKKSNNLYTGSTSDIKVRIKQHLSGRVISTKGKIPRLIHLEIFRLKTDALRREKFLKTTEGKRLLKQQIRDILQKSKNQSQSSEIV